MIKSMTGYGRANIEENLRKYQVEIKSINHKYFQLHTNREHVHLRRTLCKHPQNDIQHGRAQKYWHRDTESNHKHLHDKLNQGCVDHIRA